MDEKKRRQRQLQRQLERRRQLRRQRMVLAAIFLLLVIAVVLLLVFKGGRKPARRETPQAGTGSDTLPAGADVENTASDPVPGEEDSAQTAALSAGDVMAEAELLAKQYDYDRAIALLKEQADESDTSVAEAVSRYTQEKDQCVAVDVTRIPHVFFHSLINDDRAFKADLVGIRRHDAADV